MAAEYYEPGEAPVVEVDNVTMVVQNKGFLENDKNGKLVLTNRNLIWFEKGMFNSIKNKFFVPYSINSFMFSTCFSIFINACYSHERVIISTAIFAY